MLCALLSVTLSGCYSPARRLEVAAVKKVLPDMSRSEAEIVLGRPGEITLGSNGKTVARYFFRENRRSVEGNPELLFRTLTLLYGSSGNLERKLHDESLTPIRRANHWIEIGPALSAGSLVITKRKDRVESLVARFGEPTSRSLVPEGNTLLVWEHYRRRADRLGQPEAKTLRVILTQDGSVGDYMLTIADPRSLLSW